MDDDVLNTLILKQRFADRMYDLIHKISTEYTKVNLIPSSLLYKSFDIVKNIFGDDLSSNEIKFYFSEYSNKLIVKADVCGIPVNLNFTGVRSNIGEYYLSGFEVYYGKYALIFDKNSEVIFPSIYAFLFQRVSDCVERIDLSYYEPIDIYERGYYASEIALDSSYVDLSTFEDIFTKRNSLFLWSRTIANVFSDFAFCDRFFADIKFDEFKYFAYLKSKYDDEARKVFIERGLPYSG